MSPEVAAALLAVGGSLATLVATNIFNARQSDKQMAFQIQEKCFFQLAILLKLSLLYIQKEKLNPINKNDSYIEYVVRLQEEYREINCYFVREKI